MGPRDSAKQAQSQQESVLQIQNNKLREKLKKQSRTHALLVSIVVVFALSWFPLNVLNIVLDIHNIFEVPTLLFIHSLAGGFAPQL